MKREKKSQGVTSNILETDPEQIQLFLMCEIFYTETNNNNKKVFK